MALGSSTERVSVLSSGDGGLGGVMEAVKEGQSHPHLPPLHSFLPDAPPKYPLVLVMSHSGDGNGGNQQA